MNFFQVLRRRVWGMVEKGHFSIDDVATLQLMQIQLTVYLVSNPVASDDVRAMREIESFSFFLNKALRRVLTGLNNEDDENNEKATES
jgi:hypothetical protein